MTIGPLYLVLMTKQKTRLRKTRPLRDAVGVSYEIVLALNFVEQML